MISSISKVARVKQASTQKKSKSEKHSAPSPTFNNESILKALLNCKTDEEKDLVITKSIQYVLHEKFGDKAVTEPEFIRMTEWIKSEIIKDPSCYLKIESLLKS